LRKRVRLLSILLMILTGLVPTPARAAEFRLLSVEEYLNKMKGGWAGQMIGVSYGAPTEFKACGRTWDAPITWSPEMVENALHQDDIYVELSFLEALEKYGPEITHPQAGRAFAETKFRLWHANKQGRENVQKGIMPPDSGLPANNPHACDIDFQIEADLFGLFNPGLPRSISEQSEIFGRIMNSGDGLYGGIFTAAMYSEAFFEKDMEKIVRYGLRSIPWNSTYARTIRDVLRWHKAYPDDWRKTWVLLQEKWARHPSGQCSSDPKGFNIDASLNGAYVVIGLLYGNRDFEKTIEIATRCGQDSDCNPATAAGILGTLLGYDRIPEKFRSGIPAISRQRFEYVRYSLADLIPACLRMARQNIRRAGGRTESLDGKEYFLIPAQFPAPAR